MSRLWTRPLRSLLFVTALLAALTVVACGGSSDDSGSGSGGGGKITLVAYSTPQEAYEKIIPAFQATPDGKGVKFDQSYGASGEQSRAVEGGLPADVVAFSLAPDVDRLVDADLVDANWAKTKNDGFVTNSVVVLAVRKGNPKGIKTWDDLLKPGVEVITPNPYTSGGAKWNIMAAYGAQLEQGKSEDQAKDYLKKLFDHVPVLDKSAREALQTFTAGKGDVLLSYENEAPHSTEQGRGPRLRRAGPDDPDPEPGGGDQGCTPRRRPRSSTTCTPMRRRRSTLRRLPLREPGPRGQDEVPHSAGPVRDHEVRRLEQGQRRVLRPGGWRGHRHLPEPREVDCLRLKQPLRACAEVRGRPSRGPPSPVAWWWAI